MLSLFQAKAWLCNTTDNSKQKAINFFISLFLSYLFVSSLFDHKVFFMAFIFFVSPFIVNFFLVKIPFLLYLQLQRQVPRRLMRTQNLLILHFPDCHQKSATDHQCKRAPPRHVTNKACNNCSANHSGKKSMSFYFDDFYFPYCNNAVCTSYTIFFLK